jgi:hypothetical protein
MTMMTGHKATGYGFWQLMTFELLLVLVDNNNEQWW